LPAVLNLVVLSLLCGLKSLHAMSQFGRLLSSAQRRALGFRHAKTPSKSTLSLILRAIDVEELRGRLEAWFAARSGDDAHLAIDGKTLCGSRDGETAAVHLLAVYAAASKVVLAQAPVDGKTNEHKCALELLSKMSLQERVLTADAMFTHRDFCDIVLEKGGDYLLVVKENQANLRRDIVAAFSPQPGLSPPTTSEARSGSATSQTGR